jgi:eukaryotic-like serine/threonine-protein kinase
MTNEKWRAALDIYLAAAELPENERQSFLDSASVDAELIQKVMTALEDSESRASSAVSSRAADRIGSKLSHYIVTALLGRGGMGEVYSAQDTELDRTVALKFLRSDAFGMDANAERFVREAKAVSALNHPNIVTVYEIIHVESTLAIAMELVEGTNLRKLCGNALPVDQVIHLGQQIAQALGAAHVHGIVHRDIKPENVMVRRDGYVKVLDFGLARQLSADTQSSMAGLPIGTLRYMSPEQIRGGMVTGASDVFSLGLVLYELLTGRHPFAADSPFETAYANAAHEARPPSNLNSFVPSSLDSIVLSMLAKNSHERPPAEDVARTLPEIQRPTAGIRQATRVDVTKPSSWPIRKRGWFLAAGSAALLAASFLWYGRERIFSRDRFAFRQVTAQTREHRVTAAAISPDGRSIAFAQAGGGVFVRVLATGATRPMQLPQGLRAETMSWFADGLQLLVSGSLQAAGQPSVWLVRLDGTPARRISDDARRAIPSPDGSQIAFTKDQDTEIWLMKPDGAHARRIVAGGTNEFFPAIFWSGDSKRLSYAKVEESIGWDQLADAPKDNERFYESIDIHTLRVVASARNISIASGCLLPDGRLLFSYPDLSASLHDALYELKTNPDTGKVLGSPRPIAHITNAILLDVTASMNGKQILTVQSTSRLGVYVSDFAARPRKGERDSANASDPELTNIRPLIVDESVNFPHAWTPDSSAVIFESNRNGPFDLFKQEVNQQDVEPIVTSTTDKYVAQVSPDGKWLLYNSSKSMGPEGRRLMRVPIAGGEAQQVPTGNIDPAEFRCALPGGKHCVIRRTENRQYVFSELDPVRGVGAELARTAFTASIRGDWALSPDGTMVAIPDHDRHQARIRIVKLDSSTAGPVEAILAVPDMAPLNGLNWSADGRGWYAVILRSPRPEWPFTRSALAYIDLKGHAHVLREFEGTSFAVPAPDGNRLAFVDFLVSSNAWMLERF